VTAADCCNSCRDRFRDDRSALLPTMRYCDHTGLLVRWFVSCPRYARCDFSRNNIICPIFVKYGTVVHISAEFTTTNSSLERLKSKYIQAQNCHKSANRNSLAVFKVITIRQSDLNLATRSNFCMKYDFRQNSRMRPGGGLCSPSIFSLVSGIDNVIQ